MRESALMIGGEMSEPVIPAEEEYCGGHCGRCDETHGDWERKIAAQEATIKRLRGALQQIVDLPWIVVGATASGIARAA
jgi:hypothetical protein